MYLNWHWIALAFSTLNTHFSSFFFSSANKKWLPTPTNDCKTGKKDRYRTAALKMNLILYMVRIKANRHTLKSWILLSCLPSKAGNSRKREIAEKALKLVPFYSLFDIDYHDSTLAYQWKKREKKTNENKCKAARLQWRHFFYHHNTHTPWIF